MSILYVILSHELPAIWDADAGLGFFADFLYVFVCFFALMSWYFRYQDMTSTKTLKKKVSFLLTRDYFTSKYCHEFNFVKYEKES